MLILTRKSNESIIINNNIEIKVLGVKGDQVSLGFSAPRNISIYRKEVYESIHSENIQASEKGRKDAEHLANSLGQLFVKNKKKEDQ